MLKKTYEGYNDILKVYTERYENNWYRVLFDYHVDEKNNKMEPFDPTNDKELKIVVGRKDKVGANISINTLFKAGEQIEETDLTENIFCCHFMAHDKVYFANLANARDDWAEAGQTIVEIDTLIRDKFPGYYITDKKTW